MLTFVHIPKTAGRTVELILRRSFGVRHCCISVIPERRLFSAGEFRRIQRFCPRLASLSGHPISAQTGLEEVRPDIRYFTFLRDPLVRLASHYQYALSRHGNKIPAFEDWIDNESRRDVQTHFVAGRGATVEDAIRILSSDYLFAGLVERFDESLVMLGKRANDPRVDLWYRRLNVASGNRIKNELLGNPRTRAFLEEANRKDVALCEHAAQTLFTRFEREHGPSLGSEVSRFRQRLGCRSRLRPRLNQSISQFFPAKVVSGIRHLWSETQATAV